jgi:uncharacterized protein YbjT (DUF2867 family)
VALKIVLFGATGMVGQGVLRECLADAGVERVLVIGRTSLEQGRERGLDQGHEKLQELVHRDFFDFTPLEATLSGWDACFFCLGVSSAGMSEAEYRRVTYEITLAAATALVRQNAAMTFIYVSGAGTDSAERGRTMWARVKGETENALRKLPFRTACMFRPALIVPLHGIRSKTKSYRALYTILKPLVPVLKALLPNYVTTTEQVGRAMLEVARHGAPKPVLESRDIRALGERKIRQS